MTGSDAKTTRVPKATSDQLSEAELIEIVAGLEKLTDDSRALSAYRVESGEIESGFEVPTSEW